MSNQFINIVKKRQILEKYKDSIIIGLNIVLDKIGDQIQLEKSLNEANEANPNRKALSVMKLCKSIERYTKLKEKIERNEILEESDFRLLSIVMVTSSHTLANTAKKIVKSSEELADIAKIFIA